MFGLIISISQTRVAEVPDFGGTPRKTEVRDFLYP